MEKIKPSLVYVDLVYFGYVYEKEARKYQDDFILQIKERFPNVELKNAFDNIKGYRQEVYLEQADSDENYNAWLIGKGWFEMSLKMQILMMTASNEPENKKKFHHYISLAKAEYPEAFKPESL